MRGERTTKLAIVVLPDRRPRLEASVARRRARVPATVWGLAGSMALLLLYVGIVGGASRSLGHVLELLATDWPFVAALAVGFGTQVGLYAHLRHLTQAASAAAGATTGVGTGTSTVAMIACCAHHATDILPILGLGGGRGSRLSGGMAGPADEPGDHHESDRHCAERAAGAASEAPSEPEPGRGRLP